ncbi:MAG: hypothetical protein KZQ85_10185 [Candidatus Thiodiazotropha sp. (ex Myrtea sp. 'scaly one' KF741663)]|nr:hypothetical protein [Candidatus Thiodiazotropha sp. (ex Myrtea sp. 'scaly one' KF741663)]
MVNTGYKALLVVSLAFSSMSIAVEPKWEKWDTANSVAKEGYWLVVRQPEEGFCYIKQGYDGYSNKMELIMKRDNEPVLISPFFQGIEGEIIYRVDEGEVRKIPSSPILQLSNEVVPELNDGNYLSIEFKPAGYQTQQQKFNLSGFSEAKAWLGSATCKIIVADKYY